MAKSIELPRNQRGVMMLNPLYNRDHNVKMPVASISTTVEAPRHRIVFERYKNTITVIVAFLFGGMFCALPLSLLQRVGNNRMKMSNSGEDNEPMPRKSVMYAVLVVVGVLQPHFVYYAILTKRARDSSAVRKMRGIGKLALVALSIFISFHYEPPAPPVKSSVNVHNYTRNFGNCSLLENIPEVFTNAFEREQRLRRSAVSWTSIQGYPLVFKYYESSFKSLEMLTYILQNYGTDKEKKKRVEDCHNPLDLAVLQMFVPCDKFCRRPKYLCQDMCDKLRCYGATTSRKIDTESLWETNKDAALSLVSSSHYMGPENLKEEWLRQVMFYVDEQFHHFHDLLADEQGCRNSSFIDNHPEESCVFLNATTYEAKSYGPGTLGQNCDIFHMYEMEERMAGNQGPSTTDGHIPAFPVLTCVLCIFFFGFSLYTLRFWGVPQSRAPEAIVFKNTFLLGTYGTCEVFCFGSIACCFGDWIFRLALVKIETERIDETDTGQLGKLGVIYATLSSTMLISATVGVRLIFTSIFGYGKFADTTKPAVEKRSGLLLDKLKCIVNTYRRNTRPRGGQWFFPKAVFWECFEIALQTFSLFAFAKSRSIDYTLIACSTLLANMVIAPVLLYKSMRAADKASVSYYNGLVLFFDTVVDALYFWINLSFLDSEELTDNYIVGSLSLSWPVFCTMMRLDSLARLVSVKYLGDVRERISSAARPKGRAPPPLRKTQTVVLGMMGIMAIFTLVQFAIVCHAAIQTDMRCAKELGSELWFRAKPRKIFINGLFGEPKCNFESIEIIDAPGLGVVRVSGAIGKCTNLRDLNLKGNNIVELPPELLRRCTIDRVDLSGNPVHTALVATNLSFQEMPCFIEQHLSESIETLNLAHNKIDRVKPTIRTFTNLKKLNLFDNCIAEDGLAWEIVLLERLEAFTVGMNPVAKSLNWADMEGFRSGNNIKTNWKFATDRLLRPDFFPDLQRLNMSRNGIQSFQLKNVLEQFPKLKSVDVSFNRIKSSEFSALHIFSALGMKDLVYLNLEGNSAVTYLPYEEMEEMDLRMKTRGAYFNVHNTGLDNFVVTGGNRSRIKLRLARMKFPSLLLDQLKGSMSSFVVIDTILEQFDLDKLCNYHNLKSIYMTTIAELHHAREWGNSTLCVPKCFGQLPNLNRIELGIPLNLECLLNNSIALRTMEKVRYWPSLEPYIPYDADAMELPMFNTSSAIRQLDLTAFAPSSLPNQYATVTSNLRLKLRPSNKTYRFPLEWDHFEKLHLEHRGVKGSVSHLTIGTAGILHRTNVSGPLFHTGPNFRCAALPYSKNFSKTWNVTCQGSESKEQEEYKCNLGAPYFQNVTCVQTIRSDLIERHESTNKGRFVHYYDRYDTYFECFENNYQLAHPGCRCVDAYDDCTT